MELQSVFNGNVGTNKQPDRHGNHSMVNINFWNIIFSHFIISDDNSSTCTFTTGESVTCTGACANGIIPKR